MTSNLIPDIESLSILFDQQIGLTTTDDSAQSNNLTFNDQARQPLNVSTLAHYFGLQCDEFLRLSLNPQIESNQSGTLKTSIKNRGISFEADIKSYYSKLILSDIHDEYELLSYLRSLLNSPSGLRIAYNVKFRWTYDQNLQSNYKPDFLLIKPLLNNENRIEITIADAKSSSRMRIEHCIQVALYAIDLRTWLEKNKLDEHIFINDIGEIWLPSENTLVPYEKKTFPMIRLQDRLRKFLKYDLEKILKGSQWIMLPRCLFCNYASRCRQRAIYHEPDSINNLSYLSLSAHALVYSYCHSTSLSSVNLNHILDPSDEHSLCSDDIRKLHSILSINIHDKASAAIQALQTHEPQLKQQSSLLIPKKNQDLILIFLFLIPDPAQLHSIAFFSGNIYDTRDQAWLFSKPFLQSYPSSYQIVSMISQLLELGGKSERSCQIVLFDEQEKISLFEQLTLASDSEHINKCLILLSSSENAILLSYPPDIIETDRFFRSHALSNVKRDKIEQELYQFYGLSDDNNHKKVTKTQLNQQLRLLNQTEQEKARLSLIGLPCLICLHTAIRQSFIVPMPAYFDLEDLKYSFKISLPCLSLNQLFESIAKPEINRLVQDRFNVLVQLYLTVQHHLSEANRLPLDAYPLPNIAPIKGSHPYIRRLIFLRQYEMLRALRLMQETRYDMNESPICIQISDKRSIDKYNILWKCRIERGSDIISKNLPENLTQANDFRTYSYLIFKDIDTLRTFPDAIYMDLAIDGLRSRKNFYQCGLAHIENEEESSIWMRIKGCDFLLEINHQYYLSERYVDFNTKKAIRALEQVTPLTVQILDDPRQLKKPEAVQRINETIQQQMLNMFSEEQLSMASEHLHVLNSAQQLACEKVKSERVTLVWGPPGTGKTYWASMTTFQILMLSSSPINVLVTACTHTAIDNLLASINNIKKYLSLSPKFSRWYEIIQELVVSKIDSNNYRELPSTYGRCSLIVGSTVWTLQKLDSSIMFDVILIDEATQLLTSDAVLALNRLADHKESRLIVAGDPLQLPPIKHCAYPPLPHSIPDLFSSIFHCLLRDENNIPISLHIEKPFEQMSKCPYLCIFDENHRMNDELSDFTRLLYGEKYRQSRSTSAMPIHPIDSSNTGLLGSLLQSSCSLYTILIDSPSCLFSTRTEDLELESHIVYSLVAELVSRMSLTSVFIITPHRMQRSAIRHKLLKNPSFSDISISFDTVERMQGKEAQCVIICMLYRQREVLENELDFIYNRERINVSITRAQEICILLTSQLLIDQPPLELFVNGNTRNAYTLLCNYVNRSSVRLLDDKGAIK